MVKCICACKRDSSWNPKSNILELERLSRDHHATCVIVQQYS